MKKIFIIVAMFIISNYGQTQSWDRNGNIVTPGQFFGSINNQGVFTRTNDINRMKLNGNVSYNINGFTQPRNGYFLIGADNNSISDSKSIYDADKGPFSLLHLNGVTSSNGFQEYGYRPWMRTGITFTDNRDLSYVGLRQVGSQEDFTEMTITWSDNPSSSNAGPDDMVFRFTSWGETTGSTISTTDLQTPDDLDGLHIARFTPEGEFGLGNTFGINPTGTPSGLYVRPQSLAHYSLSNLRSVWQQFTNRNTTNGSGTGETASDGLRIGIIGNTNINANGTAALYNQENRALLLSTNENTNSINVLNGNTHERMRITSIGTPTNLSGGGFNVYNPGGLALNTTRIAFSHDPSNPITRPLSLLHLGYNTGQISPISSGEDGWRDWMDLGMFTSNGTDHVFIGLKPEDGVNPFGVNDRMDAVIAWGDNGENSSILPPVNAPDVMRFVFTATKSSTVDSPESVSNNGLEGLRMMPTFKEGIFVGVGGDPTSNLYFGSSINPTANLEVNSWGDVSDAGGSSGMRFTDLNTSSPTVSNPGDGVLSVDKTGKVIYVESSNTGIGNYCDDTENPLTDNYEIPLNSNNYYFSDPSSDLEEDKNSVIIGKDCSVTPEAKLTVFRDIGINNDFEVVGAKVVNSDLGLSDPWVAISTGVYSYTDGNNRINYGFRGFAEDAGTNVGGQFSSNTAHDGVSVGFSNTGAEVFASDGRINTGVFSMVNGGEYNYGIKTNAFNQTGTNYGIYASASSQGGSATSYAGWFDGDVFINGPTSGMGYVMVSDQQFKTDINEIESPVDLIKQLNPKSYYFDTLNSFNLNFSDHKQYGLIAQEVEEVLPELVHNVKRPAEYDSLGVEITPFLDYKGVDYNGFISIIIAAMQEQQIDLEQKETVIEDLQNDRDKLLNTVEDLNNRLTQLENCLSALLPELCQMNQSIIERNSEIEQKELLHNIDVILGDKATIILKQNVPNPFLERTTIEFVIPETISNAEIIFYDDVGRIIKAVDINERGNGRLTVYANDLSTGIYMYTLTADGKVIATKRMMKK
ncbi:MAG: tail fiber domain-containing protein [Brumimicrobium sp.]